jgi:hypothetical protein
MSKFLTTMLVATSLAFPGLAASAETQPPPCKCPKCAKDCKACCGDKCGDCCKGGTCKGCKDKPAEQTELGYVLATSDLQTSACCGSKR